MSPPISTAGSSFLVFQTALPALLLAKHKSTIQLTGGTHNMMAPSVDFIQRSFVPTLRLMNIHVSTELKIYGFFPVGGGEWTAVIDPYRPSPHWNLSSVMKCNSLPW